MLKTATAKVKNNVIGSIAGAGLGWWASAKYMNVSNKWMRVGIALLGGVAGAYAQSAITSKMGAPKKVTIKGK